MFSQIKNRIEKELPKFLQHIDRSYSLSKISPLLFKNIKEFILREGKRIRPAFFVLGYLGFAKKPARRLYTSALSLELLHDFMLVHDDIIDKSPTRRGRPSLHLVLDRYLKNFKKVKFSGQDLAIIIGDVMYALGIHAFLAIKEKGAIKEKALRRFIGAAIYTASGEFLELVTSAKDISSITRDEIYRIYDYKTACYSFASPLTMGAILAGASDKEADRLFKYGIYLGRAFQIKDDILGTFGNEKKIGKPTFSDLKEAKKTILVWYAFRHASGYQRERIEKVFAEDKAKIKDLVAVREIIQKSGALDYAEKEIRSLIKKAERLIRSSAMRRACRESLYNYTHKLLEL